MRLPAEVVLGKRIRAQRKIVRSGVWTAPSTGAYDEKSRHRRHLELAAITAKA